MSYGIPVLTEGHSSHAYYVNPILFTTGGNTPHRCDWCCGTPLSIIYYLAINILPNL